VVTGIQTDSEEMGPAIRWRRDNGIVTTLVQAFEYAEQVSREDFINWITEVPLPPFRPAWFSSEEFEARAAEILEINPKAHPVFRGDGLRSNPTRAPSNRVAAQ
jgi:hypothetical protein